MTKSASTRVIDKLNDLELLFKLKADLSRFRKKKEQASDQGRPPQAA